MITAELIEQIDKCLRFGAGNMMRKNESDAGWTLIMPDERAWLPAMDWSNDIVISERGDQVRIVAIVAAHPGHGAFSRLIDGIIAEGKTPLVVQPLGAIMLAILKRWDWRRRVLWSGSDQQEVWRPTREWMQRRIAA